MLMNITNNLYKNLNKIEKKEVIVEKRTGLPAKIKVPPLKIKFKGGKYG